MRFSPPKMAFSIGSSFPPLSFTLFSNSAIWGGKEKEKKMNQVTFAYCRDTPLIAFFVRTIDRSIDHTAFHSLGVCKEESTRMVYTPLSKVFTLVCVQMLVQ